MPTYGIGVCTICTDVDRTGRRMPVVLDRPARAVLIGGLTAVRKSVLGLDGGNTKTVAIVAGLDGVVLGTGPAGCGDIYGSTAEAALSEIDAAIDGALAEAGRSREDVVAAGCSLAGADWPEDYEFLDAEMRRRLPNASACGDRQRRAWRATSGDPGRRRRRGGVRDRECHRRSARQRRLARKLLG